jgi:hypothetical protein
LSLQVWQIREEALLLPICCAGMLALFAALWCRALPERLQRHTRRLTAWLRAVVLVMGAGIGIGL